MNNDTSCECERSCIVWVNGVSWESIEGIRTVVELVDGDKCVVITVLNRSETSLLQEYITEHHSELIKLVQDLKQQVCPHMKTQEYCINCDLMEIETGQNTVQVKEQDTVVNRMKVGKDNGKNSLNTLSSTAVDTDYTPNHGEV